MHGRRWHTGVRDWSWYFPWMWDWYNILPGSQDKTPSPPIQTSYTESTNHVLQNSIFTAHYYLIWLQNLFKPLWLWWYLKWPIERQQKWKTVIYGNTEIYKNALISAVDSQAIASCIDISGRNARVWFSCRIRIFLLINFLQNVQKSSFFRVL